jgi:predicted dinucleotide-binding enzyme
MRVTIVGAGNMGRGIGTRAVAGGHQVEIVAGDDQAAKQTVSQLVSDGGLRPIDVGPLSRAQQLEHLGLLHISLQQPLGLGSGSAIRLHP